jgi:hypothetical protein
MIVQANGWLAAHVQIRGSVPLHWHQRSMKRGSLSYNPKPRIEGDLATNVRRQRERCAALTARAGAGANDVAAL